MRKIFFSILGLLVLLAAVNELRLRNNSVAPAPAPVVKIKPIKSLGERKLNGPVVMYYDNGQLKAERFYRDSKLNGIYRMYHNNGQLKIDGTYKDDKMEGMFQHYNENGQLQIEEIYHDNIPVARKIFNH